MNDNMTAPTPEQMRALADWLDAFGAGTPHQAMPEELSDSADALRAAADQIEAVQTICDRALSVKVAGSTTADVAAAAIASVVKNAIRTADTAPKEDRDEG